MPLPIEAINPEDAAEDVIRRLKLIKRESIVATSTLDSGGILDLYYRVNKALSVVAAYSSGGLSMSVIGPIIGAKRGFTWADERGNFTTLKNTTIPALVGFVEANQVAICQHQISESKGSIEHSPLSQQLKDEAAPLIAALTAFFEA